VLVVDDSAYARVNIAKHLEADPQIEVVGTARDGIEAVEMTRELRPSVVTLDVSMPRMDGLTALEHIMSECPTPVVMLSVLTSESTQETIRALELGAADFFLKPSVATPAGTSRTVKELRTKVKLASQVPVAKLRPAPGMASPASTVPRSAVDSSRRADPKIVVIGCSTGGPQTLCKILPKLPRDIPASFLVIQHIHPDFTHSLALRLDGLCHISVKEAQAGDLLLPGHALIAPGDHHMTVDSDRTVFLDQGPPECNVRPSVNVTIESVVKHFPSRVLGVILTGMGTDGARGAALIKAAGGKVLVQDEATCVIYGMPKSVVDAGNADQILPMGEIAREIALACKEPV
jgi:two-component system chemotaxis response regulator CheB